MVDKIGLKDRKASVTIMLTSFEPYVMPCLDPEGVKSLYWSMEISFLSFFFQVLYKLFETLTYYLECLPFNKHNIFCSE